MTSLCLQECLFQQRIILSQWRDSALLQIIFSSGLLVNVFVNVHTGDVLNIVFDKFLVGKLLSDYVVGGKYLSTEWNMPRYMSYSISFLLQLF